MRWMFGRKQKGIPGLATSRIESFSDGIFGFAITLLVLNLSIPEVTQGPLTDNIVQMQLFQLWPKFLTYLISFSIIGIFWIGHTIMFHYIKRADRMLLWFNALLLLCIAFMPFPTNLLSRNFFNHTSVILYGFTLMMAGAFFVLTWLYATRNKKLVDAHLNDKLIRKGLIVVSIAPIVYLVAILLSFVHVNWALGIYIAVPILYVIPSPIDELVKQQ